MAKKFLTEAEIWLKVTRWCDYQERSQQEARDKLYSLGLHKSDVENLIVRLISDGFVNEERFAIAYARGKFRISEWGRIKIKLALQQKKISEYCIKRGMAEIDEEEYHATILRLIQKKLDKCNEENPLLCKNAAVRYVISRGFEPNLVFNLLQMSGEE
jgi:regulatory protein